MIGRFSIAWSFLTAIPFPFSEKGNLPPEVMGRALPAFPWVGLALGLILAAANWLLGTVLPPAMLSLSVLFLLVLLTRGLHLDGLADTIDGLQGRNREESLRIMKEGTIGAFGATGLFFVLGFKIAGLASLPPGEAVRALLIMPVIGRWSFVTLMAFFPYGRPEGGLGAPFISHAGIREWAWATLFTLLMVLSIAPLRGIGVAGTALLFSWIAGRYFTRRLGGVTGDTIGATGEIIEAFCLIQWNVYRHVWE